MRAVYSLFLYSCTQHGVVGGGLYASFYINSREYLLVLLHWFPLNVMVLKSEVLVLCFYLNSLIKILICGVKDMKFHFK